MKNCKFTLPLLCLTAVLLGTSAVAQQPGLHASTYTDTAAHASTIRFEEGSWKEVLQKAAAAHKRVFVDAYASWCGPCKMLKSVTFRNRKAADFFNQHFLNVSIDMEKGEGVALAQQWQIEAYPTLIIFDEKGKPVLAAMGFMTAKDLIRFGEEALRKNVAE